MVKKGAPLMSGQYLREDELAARWGISPRTLEKWRAEGQGPAYHRIGKSILYAPDDIFEHEKKTRVEAKK